MFSLGLFRIRAFTAGTLATLLASLGRGGLMFMLIIWLQGIWLPLHGYSFSETPLWAGIYMLPLTVGFLIAGPASGWLSDRYGARPFATGGMLVAGAHVPAARAAAGRLRLPRVRGAAAARWASAMGLFASPNLMGIMNSVPAHRRGVGAGMAATFQNSAMVLSIGIFFSLMIVGLTASLPATLNHGLVAQGVPAADATRIAHLPPSACSSPRSSATTPCSSCSGRRCTRSRRRTPPISPGAKYFPRLIAEPFANGLHVAFDFAIVCCLIAAAASWLRGAPLRARRAGGQGGDRDRAIGAGASRR